MLCKAGVTPIYLPYTAMFSGSTIDTLLRNSDRQVKNYLLGYFINTEMQAYVHGLKLK